MQSHQSHLKKNTGCRRDKFTEFRCHEESSDSVQHIEEGPGGPGTKGKKRQEEKCGRHWSSQSDLRRRFSYNERERKTRRDKINTGCCWNRFSEFKSLESSDSVQRIQGGQGDPGRTRKTTGKPEEACGRYRSSSVHPDRFSPFLSQARYVFSPQSWSRPGQVLPSLDCSNVARQPTCEKSQRTQFAQCQQARRSARRGLAVSPNPC